MDRRPNTSRNTLIAVPGKHAHVVMRRRRALIEGCLAIGEVAEDFLDRRFAQRANASLGLCRRQRAPARIVRRRIGTRVHSQSTAETRSADTRVQIASTPPA